MAFPSTPILDTFNRPDENPLAGIWTAFTGLGGLRVVSNQCGISNAGYVFCGDFIGQNFFDAEAYVTWNTLDGAVESQLIVRVTDSTTNSFTTIGDLSKNGYFFAIAGNGTTCYIDRMDASALTTIASTTVSALAGGDAIGVSAIGSTITGWLKRGAGAWTSVVTANDATYTHGAIALETNSPVVRYDDFGGGNITNPSDNPPIGFSGRGAGW